MSLGVLITTEGTLIGLGYYLCCFEAKKDNYKSYEDIDNQFIHFQGQNVQSQRKQNIACTIGYFAVRSNFIISYDAVLRLS